MPDNTPHRDLDLRITQTLESSPSPSIPSSFAARTAASAVSRYGALPTAAPSSPSHVAVWTIRVSLALLFAAMLFVIRVTGASSTSIILLETTFAAEFVALALYLTLRPASLR